MQANATNCPGCGAGNRAEALFCLACGRPLPRTQAAVAGGTCPGCGARGRPDARFCLGCGRPMPASVPAGYPTPSPPVPAGSRGRKPLVFAATAVVVAAALVVGLWKPGLIWRWADRDQSGLLAELNDTYPAGGVQQTGSVPATTGPGTLTVAETKSGTVSAEKTVIALSGATVDFGGSLNLDSEAKAEVSRMVPEADEESTSTRTTYDISLEGKSEFAVPLEVTLPYDPALCVPNNEAGSVAVQYYNPDTAEWETMMFAQVDTEAKTVSFLTSHLSLYSVYQFNDILTPRATISHLAPNVDIDNAMEILSEYADNGAPGTMAKAGFGEMVGEFILKGSVHKDAPGYEMLQDYTTAATLDTIYSGVMTGLSMYESTQTMADLYGDCGLALAGFRVLVAGIDGRHQDAAIAGYDLVFNKLASMSLGSAFSIASLAVIPVKYAIAGVQAEAISANLRGTENAYKAYYQDGDGNWARTDDMWVQLFIELYMEQWQSGAPCADDLMADFDRRIDDYCNEFWQLDDVDKALEGKLGGNDTWVHPNMVGAEDRAKMIRNFRSALISRINSDIMPILERFMQGKAQEQLKKPLLQFMRLMNAAITVTLDENIPTGSFDEPKYHGYYLRYEFDSPGSDADFRTTQLPEQGSAYKLPWFTVLGYTLYDMPSYIRLYKNLDDLKLGKPALDIPLKITSRDVVINIGNGELTFEDIIGTYDSTSIISGYSMPYMDEIMEYMPPELLEQYGGGLSQSMDGSYPGVMLIEATGENTCTLKTGGDTFGSGSYDIVYGDGTSTTEYYDYSGMIPYYDGVWNQENLTLALYTQGSPLNADLTLQFKQEGDVIRFVGSGRVDNESVSYNFELHGMKKSDKEGAPHG